MRENAGQRTIGKWREEETMNREEKRKGVWQAREIEVKGHGNFIKHTQHTQGNTDIQHTTCHH